MSPSFYTWLTRVNQLTQTDYSASIKSQKLNSKLSSGKLLQLEAVVERFPEL